MANNQTGKPRFKIAVTATAVAIFSLALLTSSLMPAISVNAQATTDDAAARVAKNNQYLAEAQSLANQREDLREQVAAYEKQKESATSEEEKQELDAKIKDSIAKVDDLERQMRELEKLNQALYVIDSSLEAKLYSVNEDLVKRYLDNASATYVGDNPVEFVFPNVLTGSIEIMVNPDKVAPDGSNVPAEKSIDGIPIKITYGKTEPISCSPASRTGVCRPLKGGVSVSEFNTLSLNTLGYKATRQGDVGIVIAGHTAVQPLSTIVQPHNDASKSVAQTLAFCYDTNNYRCDFAWAKAYTTISVENKIYGSSDTSNYSVTSTTPDSGQTLGTFVYESSAASGLRVGDINGNAPGNNYNTVKITPNNGDSGSPLFTVSGSNANLYGMAFRAAGSYTMYYAQDYIQSTIGAVPSTS